MRLDKTTRQDAEVFVDFFETDFRTGREVRRVKIHFSCGNRQEAMAVESMFLFLRDSGGRTVFDDVSIREASPENPTYW